jgi:uncharacterized MAPEG superfamily protein
VGFEGAASHPLGTLPSSVRVFRQIMSTSSISSPSVDEWNNLIKMYAVATAAIFVKYCFSLFYAANSAYHPDEDKAFLMVTQPEDARRRERQFVNDMENIPVHLSMFWAAFIIQNLQNASGNGGRNGTLCLSALILIYALSRTIFTVCYIRAIQPFRTIFYVVATMSVFGACMCLIIASFQVDMSQVFHSIASDDQS